ncbi:glycosyltransferase family 4 protein, partial [Patescibacteria group bacterium]
MKLIIATGIYPPDIGGPATYSKKIAEEFSKKGWKISVITYSDNIPPLNPPLTKGGSDLESVLGKGRSDLKSKILDGNECSPPLQRGELEGGVRVIKISRKHSVLMRYFLYVWKLIKLARKSDLIYAQGPVSEGLPAYLTSKITGKKYVLKIVGDCAWERWQNCDTNIRMHANYTNNTNECAEEFITVDEFQNMKDLPFKTKMLRWVEGLVAKNAYKIITPSQYLKKIVEKWGADSAKIKVIYNAGDTNLHECGGNTNQRECPPAYDSVRAGEHESTRMGGEDFSGDIILSAGRLVPWKGMDLLIELMPELLELNSNFKLVIVGDGPGYERLKSRIAVGVQNFEPMQSDDKIILTGKLKHKELLEYMKKAKMFVLNSGYEGLPHTVIEAMYSGLPCAISNVGGNPEIVENEKTGLLFKYNNKEQIKDAIRRLWQNDELRGAVV